MDNEKDDMTKKIEELLKEHPIVVEEESQDEKISKNVKPLSLSELNEKYKNLEDKLLEFVKGQDYPVKKICKTLFNKELVFDQNENTQECYASFFLFGAPGTGKTYTAEQIAKILNLPFMRFDMAEYSDENDQIGLIGSDRQFRNASDGTLTKFIFQNEDTKHVLIFDEVEKAHQNTLNIFLSMLGSGELFDQYRRKSLTLKNSIIFFTSNAGKDLYSDNTNISNVTINKLLDALQKDVDLQGRRRLSPEFCSRIVSGTAIVFNNLRISDLSNIVDQEAKEIASELKTKRTLKLVTDKYLSLAFLYMSGKKDARIVSSRFKSFIMDKIYQIPFDKNDIKTIEFGIDYKSMPEEIKDLFIKRGKYRVIYIGNSESVIKALPKNKYELIKVTDSLELKESLRQNIDIVLVDPLFGGMRDKLISVTDYNSKGIDLFYELTEFDSDLMVYILTDNKSMINEKDKQSLIGDGAKDLISVEKIENLESKVNDFCRNTYIEKNISKLINKGWILDCKNKLVIDKANKKASIILNKFRKYMDYDSDALKLMLKEEDRPNIKFADIIGANNAKEELKYFIYYLKDPLSDKNLKLKAPKGILLYGPPGTGKTMLAKAMANEAKINYISLNGSDLIGYNQAYGIQKIKDVFGYAKQYAPTIIFIDEIDAIAKRRTGASDEAILNSLLTEMDGFKTSARKPVFVLAATNFPIFSNDNSASIDPAILRRFDCQLYVDLPNKTERIQFIEKYLSKKGIKIEKDAINTFAECTVGMSLAIIENIIELAIRNSIRNNIKLDGSLLLETYDEYSGGEKRDTNKHEAYVTAIHEAGHAFALYLSGKTPVYITIESRAYYGGYVNKGEIDKKFYTKDDILSQIRCCLAGRASEELFFKEDGINTGAGNDLLKATEFAKKIVCGYGMSNRLAVFENDVNIDENEIEEILQNEYEYIKQVLKENKNTIKKIADTLVIKNHLTGKEFKAILKAK